MEPTKPVQTLNITIFDNDFTVKEIIIEKYNKLKEENEQLKKELEEIKNSIERKNSIQYKRLKGSL